MATTNIHLLNVKKGKNQNWLTIESSIAYVDSNTVFVLDYCGTELTNRQGRVPENMLEALRLEIKEDFLPIHGLEFAKESLKKKSCYKIKF